MSLEVVTVVKGPSPELDLTSFSVQHLLSLGADLSWTLVVANSDDAIENLLLKAKYNLEDRLKVIGQQSTGLYAAMNEGLARITSDHYIFINSGDILTEATIGLSRALSDEFITCFKTSWHDQSGTEISGPPRHRIRSVALGLMPSHQAMVFPRRFSSSLYDSTMAISADMDLKIRFALEKKLVYRSDSISSSLRAGLSASPLTLMTALARYQETRRVMGKHFNPIWASFVSYLYGIRFLLRIMPRALRISSSR